MSGRSSDLLDGIHEARDYLMIPANREGEPADFPSDWATLSRSALPLVAALVSV